MTSVKLIFGFILSDILLTSGCVNHCEPKSYLTDYDKSWITYSGNQKLFWNQNSNELFTYSELTDEFVESTFRGEECGDVDRLETMTFNLSGSTLPYNFDFKLWSVKPEGAPYDACFSILANEMSLNLNIYDDTAIAYSSGEYIDQINLNGIIFQNVYHAGPDSMSASLTDFYFTKENGIVGFKTKSGETWSIL